MFRRLNLVVQLSFQQFIKMLNHLDCAYHQSFRLWPNRPKTATTTRRDHAMANHQAQHLFQLTGQEKDALLLSDCMNDCSSELWKFHVYLNYVS